MILTAKLNITEIKITYNLEIKGLEESKLLYHQVPVTFCRLDNVRRTVLKFDAHLRIKK